MHRRWTGAVIVAAAAVLGVALWQHAVPPGFTSVLGVDPVATAEMHAALGLRAPAVSFATFAFVFRALLVLGFAAYGVLLWCVFRAPDGTAVGAIRWVAGALPIVVALVMPADLSTDVFAYVGYGRLAVVHGMNPQVTSPVELVRLGDPLARTVHWGMPSPYGPIWTLTTIAVVAIVPRASVLAAVVVMKLLAAGALLGTAVATRRIVRQLDEARADAAFVAVALNPLLLIEGPGSGHNDIIAALFVVLAFLALLRRRPALAGLAVGAAGAIKLVPLLLLPWVAFVAARAMPDRRAGVKAAAIVLAMGLLPLVVGYVPLWAGARTFASVVARWQLGNAGGATALIAPLLWLALFGLASAHLYRSARAGLDPAVGVLISAWALLVVPLMPLAMHKLYPWYLTWAWSAALLRWTKVHQAVLVWLLPVSLLLALLYTV